MTSNDLFYIGCGVVGALIARTLLCPSRLTKIEREIKLLLEESDNNTLTLLAIQETIDEIAGNFSA